MYPYDTPSPQAGATNDGRVTVYARHTPGYDGVWTYENSTMTPRAIHGTQLPVAGGVVTVNSVAFEGWSSYGYSQPPEREVFWLNGALWTGWNGGTLLFQSGTPVPLPGYVILSFGQTLPTASDGGVVFQATVRLQAAPFTVMQALCAWDGEAMRVVMRSDIDLPGHPAGTRWVLTSPGDARATIVSDGRVVATPFVTGNSMSLLREGPLGMETLARLGMPTPDDPTQQFLVNYQHSQFAATGFGQVAFTDFTGVYMTDEQGVPRTILRSGARIGNGLAQVPYTDSNYRLSNGHDGRPRWLNDAGQVVCTTSIGPSPWSTVILVQQGPHIDGAPINCNDTDFNNDGLYGDPQDIADFISAIGGASSGTVLFDSIDFNNDGMFPDTMDIESFLSVASGGPCL